MKKLLIFVVILVVVAAMVQQNWAYLNTSFNNLISFSYCDNPIKYKVDTVDPRFNVSEKTFLTDIKNSAQIWNNAEGKTLFEYDPKGDLSVNLVYDERQSLNSQVNQLENQVQAEKQSLTPRIDQYKKLSQDFQQKVQNYNQEVESWNSKGGAPPEEYNKIIQEQQDLRAEANSLNEMARSLNLSADSFNSQVNELNQTISNFNDVLEQRPEEGIYKGPENRIEIYIHNNEKEFIHTITHELGHALGIGHVSDSQAIMYAKTSKKTVLTEDDIAALTEACKKHTYIELIQQRVSQILAYYSKQSN